jgi:hypothetical protein
MTQGSITFFWRLHTRLERFPFSLLISLLLHLLVRPPEAFGGEFLPYLQNQLFEDSARAVRVKW